MNRLIIVTGSSRGIGKAVAAKFLEQLNDDMVIGVARSAASHPSANYRALRVDLSGLEGCRELLAQVTAFVNENSPASLIFVNNAGQLGEVEPSWQLSPTRLAETLFLNMTAPMVLQNGMVAICAAKNLPLEIVNVSSGAARHEYYGWAGYCSSKAGFLMAAKVLALEITQLQQPAKVWNLAPGIVDTAMQETLRRLTAEQFAEVERFKALHAEGKLRSPESVADFLYNAVGKDEFENGGFYDIRTF